MTVAFPEWIEIGGVDDIPLQGARVVKTPLGDIAVFRTAAGRVYAIDDRCPHRGGPLSQGIVHDDFVTCPLHNWVINLATGKAEGADSGCVATFPIRIQDGRLLLSTASLELMKVA